MTKKTPWLEGEHLAPEVNAPMRPQDAAEFMTLWGGQASGGRFFQRILLLDFFERYRTTSPPNGLMKRRFFFKAAVPETGIQYLSMC